MAVDEARLVVTGTDSFSPREFRADPAAITFLADRITTLNRQLASGAPPLPEDVDLHDLLVSRSSPYIQPAGSCGGGCSCSAFTPRKRVELFLLLAQYCNLGCVYCLEGDDTYQIKRRLRMSEETALAAADRVVEMLGPGDTLTVTFFGGEPLLNWRTAEAAIAHIKRLCIEKMVTLQFGVQTNLTFLPPTFIETARNENMIVMCSLDGPEAVHNDLRPHRDRSANSHRMTVEKLALLREAGVPFNLRATITSRNADILCEVADHHKELGALGTVFGLLRPVNSDAIVFDKALAPSPEVLSRSFAELYDHHPEIVEETILGLLSQMRPGIIKSAACGAASMGTPTIDSNGDVYSCVWFVGQPDRIIGNVRDPNFLNATAVDRNRDEFENAVDPVCAACDYLPICRGGCSATRIVADNGDAGRWAKDIQRDQQCSLVKTLTTRVLLDHERWEHPEVQRTP
ncbi:radical SAM protein [Agrobacterium salinitolerans]|nr:radical SAM protein [Agrobacterium salinitolerans]